MSKLAYAPPSARKVTAPAPPPTPEQMAALEALKAEAETYRKGAADYSDTVTKIVRLHYEQKKKEILSGLDREISVEQSELRKARDVAIQRLQEFVTKYSGARVQPEATPDAMYRLAALYEERARESDATDDLAQALKPAVDLYRQLIREFPKYRELAAIYYFLGHAYNDSGRIEEAQQVWRSLVCHNRFPYPTAPSPTNADADTILPLPQDHDEPYWSEWRRAHHDDRSLKKGGPDTTFVDPYPADCESIPQPSLLPGEEPRFLAETWWQIGNWEFNQLDQHGGYVRDEPAAVYDYNRAVSAYGHSLQFKKPNMYGVALYMYAWALYKQQRYEQATREFVHLLLFTDQQQKDTGDPGADFRNEAYTYIATSLANVDFRGPEASEPYISRPDIIDLEPRAAVAEQKLHVAIDRVKDPSIIPQDRPWTIEVYKALAGEYRSLNEFHNAIDIYQDILKRWPMDPTAPEVQNSVAETFDQLNATVHSGTAEHDENAARALEARTALANYIGATPWVDANKDNPAALQNAERLVRVGLRQAAAEHTNRGRAELLAAGQSNELKEQTEHLTRSVAEYKLAAIGWEGFLKQDENAPDAYESRFWIADARHNQVRIEVQLHKANRGKYGEPSTEEVESAKASAVAVRDSDEDDKYLEPAAQFVVDESDVGRDLEYQRWEDTRGGSGFEERAQLRFDGTDPETRTVVTEPIPSQVQASMAARDEYLGRVPANLDVNHRALDYQWYGAAILFNYGHLDEARARFEPMYKEHCGKDEYGFKAWEKLISMSNFTRDAERSRQLAEAEKNHSCAVDEKQKVLGQDIVRPTIQQAFYQDAAKVFKQAEDAQPGPARDALWRKAAGMYEGALLAAPARDEAPEAAINGAYAYKQVGEFGKAIAMYDKFISEYGSEERMNGLQRGDAKTKPDAKKYAARLRYLGQAYDELSQTFYGFFNYQKAADTYEKIGSTVRFDDSKRKDAARNAMVLYANMGEREKASANYHTFMSLHPTPEEKANADFLVADYDHKQWSVSAPDTGANREARQAAQASLESFYMANRSNPAATKYSLQAAYWVFKMKKTVSDPGYRQAAATAVTAWQSFHSHAPLREGKSEALIAPFSDFGAEAQFAIVDDEIHREYDIETGHHKYAGSVPEIIGEADKSGHVTQGKYQHDAAGAQKYDEALLQIIRTYPSLEWVPAATARQGMVYDALRTGLYNAVPPAVKYFTPKQDALLARLENSGVQQLQDQADDLRTSVKDGWRKKKEVELAGADELMVNRYATAVAYARKYNVRNALVTHAVERLAYFTDIIGEAKMREYVARTKDPTDLSGSSNLTYTDGMYLQARPGLTVMPPAGGEAPSAPVAP